MADNMQTYEEAYAEAISLYESNRPLYNSLTEKEAIKNSLDIHEAFKHKDGVLLDRIASNVAKKGAIFVEIGSWKGYATTFLADVARNCGGKVYCIDHWKGSGGVPHHRIDNCLEIFLYNMKVLGLDDYVHPMVMDSLTASKVFADGVADLVFIDADHRYDGIKSDLIAWWPKIKIGGILCGHDCETYYSNANSAIQSLFAEHLNEDAFLGIHMGVVTALYECFNDKHTIEKGSSMWSIKKEDNGL